MKIDDIRKLAAIKSESIINNDEDYKKINLVNNLLKDDKCFFNIPIEIAIPILLYLGVKEENVKDVYFELISYKNFSENNIVRRAIDI